MNAKQAKQAGVAAYQAGKGRAPALNQAFLREACATGDLCTMMDCYSNGWTIAHLADGASDDMPSVQTLREILS
jgi:hypothetical protein